MSFYETNAKEMIGKYIQEADEGIYSLKSSNEKITNPDYLATFNVTATRDDE